MVALVPRANQSAQKLTALVVTSALFLLSLLLVRDFQPTAAMQFVEEHAWLPGLRHLLASWGSTGCRSGS